MAFLACDVAWSDPNQPGSSTGEAAADAWPMERVKLVSGKEYVGLVRQEDEAAIEFVEVRRPAGKPTGIVVRSVDRRQIVSWQRLDEAGRNELARRIERFKNRAEIEARRMSELPLLATRRDGAVVWEYPGTWFSLRSTTDEATTRRAIVRLEQVLTGYRQILPPRERPMRPFEITVFGDTSAYKKFLGGLGIELSNPAFFAADFNLVVAGSDLDRFQAELAQVRRQNQEALAAQEADKAAAPERMRKLSEELKAGGVPDEQRQKILAAEQKRIDQKRERTKARLAALERENTARHDKMIQQMLARLYHEAFHAYLENYVYPRGAHDVPRWLNEGLAQTFEGGLVESESLRVDAPNKRLLERLLADLAAAEPLHLADVLDSDATSFLAAHRAASGEASRLYLYSWGLAYYLTFETSLLGSPEFENYLRPAAADEPPIARFERLVGESLPQFEASWRGKMLRLKP